MVSQVFQLFTSQQQASLETNKKATVQGLYFFLKNTKNLNQTIFRIDWRISMITQSFN
jgi:hypothetical protein